MPPQANCTKRTLPVTIAHKAFVGRRGVGLLRVNGSCAVMKPTYSPHFTCEIRGRVLPCSTYSNVLRVVRRRTQSLASNRQIQDDPSKLWVTVCSANHIKSSSKCDKTETWPVRTDGNANKKLWAQTRWTQLPMLLCLGLISMPWKSSSNVAAPCCTMLYHALLYHALPLHKFRAGLETCQSARRPARNSQAKASTTMTKEWRSCWQPQTYF